MVADDNNKNNYLLHCANNNYLLVLCQAMFYVFYTHLLLNPHCNYELSIVHAISPEASDSSSCVLSDMVFPAHSWHMLV